MRTANQVLTQYAAYHRDRRNIATHFVGVPIIVFSVVLALAQVVIGPVHLGWIGIILATIYYLVLDRPLGFLLFGFLVLCGAVASLISFKTGWAAGLAIAAGLFVLGWAIQFLGHKYEGIKPAFVDDIVGLLIGPLFVMVEVLFLLGLRGDLKSYIEARVGPTMARRDGKPLGPGDTTTNSKMQGA
ncbi:MAG: DUF962 domain-containing protein [Rhodocyclaceae bacterium]|jgi:uncharacterized membrane protein YGL010W|nr:DUF962 domain-containing protein [Rhodocyclaceae bacterium]MCA3030035.1 DUF962 domain-containing protein [Rhodocyclaceae bacterium]MCA3044110.1 DUF962 domain-containing protein [Rhodocyclaceae bacterium]MCA3060109.1 DUF962 domain-containing protein [Rhodocyclaceae bacterium]MCA3082472.1 DUF962 domain-containing protein [Rhodocyclaceae bacterium]